MSAGKTIEFVGDPALPKRFCQPDINWQKTVIRPAIEIKKG
jgi:hypothetical protein